MADRLTQLQDTINQVRPLNFTSITKIRIIHSFIFLFSKQNTFATVLEFFNSVPYPVDFPVMIDPVPKLRNSHKKILPSFSRR